MGVRKLDLLALVCLCILVLGLSPVTSAPVPPPVNNYTVSQGGVTCVVMTASIQLTIPYTSQGKNISSSITIPSNATWNGTCGTNSSTNILNIYFNDGWTFSIVFSSSSKGDYSWSDIVMSYRFDSQHFPGISNSSLQKLNTQTTHLPSGTYPGSVDGSYACQGERTLSLNGSISLTVGKLQYRAFGRDGKTDFPSKSKKFCEEETPVPETDVGLAVSVGIALVAMIVFVIIVYLVMDRVQARIQRRKDRLD